jgi:hypothetical protein
VRYLHNVKSRPAKADDKLTTRLFSTRTVGEDGKIAVCVLPGTKLAFANKVDCQPPGSLCTKEGL